jgi:hypothetical protein
VLKHFLLVGVRLTVEFICVIDIWSALRFLDFDVYNSRQVLNLWLVSELLRCILIS